MCLGWGGLQSRVEVAAEPGEERARGPGAVGGDMAGEKEAKEMT
jgi:hypothetical protein